MSPEASAFLDKARQFLSKADDMFADVWPDEAGRAAYLAGLHAAQAVIVERTRRVIRRHTAACTTNCGACQRAIRASTRNCQAFSAAPTT